MTYNAESAVVMAVELIIAPEVEQDSQRYTRGTKRGGPGWAKSFKLRLCEYCGDLSYARDVCGYPQAVPPEVCGRFPYVIFYEYTAATVTVYGVLHTSRDPDKWRQRLP